MPAPTVTKKKLYGYLYTLRGAAIDGAAVRLSSNPVPNVMSRTYALEQWGEDVTTDSIGYFEVNVVVGAQVEIYIEKIGFRKLITMPGSDTNLFSLA